MNDDLDILDFREQIKIGVVGAGTMGSGISYLASLRGHSVVLYDKNLDALKRADTNVQRNIQRIIEKGTISETQGKSMQNRIKIAQDLGEMRSCTLILEAISEDLSAKQEIFKKLETIVSKECTLASNTSSLCIGALASVCQLPSRVLGLHFFNPPHVMPLVEIIPSLHTTPQIVALCKGMLEKWGKTCVVAKDTPGFIVNRVSRPFYLESLRMLDEGVADAATIDWAMKELGEFKMGPFELMDFVGNDLNYRVSESLFEGFFYDSRFRPSVTQRTMVKAKLLGRKTGKGFYDYAQNMPFPVPNQDKILGDKILSRVLCLLINEAIDALFQNVAKIEDIETAVVKGLNYPQGLLAWADELGLENIYKQIEELHEEYREDRYRPSPLLKRMIKNKQKFHTINKDT